MYFKRVFANLRADVAAVREATADRRFVLDENFVQDCLGDYGPDTVAITDLAGTTVQIDGTLIMPSDSCRARTIKENFERILTQLDSENQSVTTGSYQDLLRDSIRIGITHMLEQKKILIFADSGRTEADSACSDTERDLLTIILDTASLKGVDEVCRNELAGEAFVETVKILNACFAVE